MRRRRGGGDSAGGACGAGWAERRPTQSDPAAGHTGKPHQHQSLGSARSPSFQIITPAW